MKQKINVAVLANLLDLWRDTKEDRNYQTVERNFSALTPALKWITDSVKEQRDLIRNCSLKSFAYVGEFFERYHEKGFEMNEELFSALVLFYAMGKSTDAFDDVDFNNYQIDAFEKMLEESIIENEYIDYAKYLLTGETQHLDNLISNREKANVVDLLWALSIVPASNKDFILEYTKSRKLLFFELLFNVESSLPIISIFLNEFERRNIRADKTISKTIKKEIPLLDCLLAATDGKLITEKMQKMLIELGFTKNNSYSINFLLLKRTYIGDLKRQKAAKNTIEFLTSSSEEFNSIDVLAIKEVSEMSFSVKMDGGNITSVRSLFEHGDYQNNIKSPNNYKKFLEAISRFEFLSRSRNNGLTFRLDISKDEHYFEKITYLMEKINSKDFLATVVERHCEDISRGKDITIEEQRQKVENVVKIIETDFDMKVTDFFSISSFTCSSHSFYQKLCSLGICNALENLKENAVQREFSYKYFIRNSDVQIYDAIKFLYENNGKPSNLIMDDFYNYRHMGKMQNFLLDELDCEKKREMIDIVSEDILLNQSKTYFYNFFLNLLLGSVDEIKKIYTDDEIEKMYHMGIELLNNKDNFQDSSYRYDNKSYINLLKETYMTDEEKARLEEEKRLAELERERQAKNEQIKEIENIIKNCLEVKKTSDYENRKTRTSLEFYEYVINSISFLRSRSKQIKNFCVLVEFIQKEIIVDSVVSKDNIEDYFGLLGFFVKENIVSCEQAANSISNIRFLEDLMEENVAVA